MSELDTAEELSYFEQPTSQKPRIKVTYEWSVSHNRGSSGDDIITFETRDGAINEAAKSRVATHKPVIMKRLTAYYPDGSVRLGKWEKDEK